MTGHCNATDSAFLFFVQNFVNKIMRVAHMRERKKERNGKNLYSLEQIIIIMRIFKITTTENPNSRNPMYMQNFVNKKIVSAAARVRVLHACMRERERE
jgi:hypothetical protein